MRVNLVLFLIVSIISAGLFIAGNTSSADTEEMRPVDEIIIQGIGKRYAVAGFTAQFEQFSTLKAMNITDTASGTILVKRPSMMRWVYEEPDKQEIVSDGEKLWVHRPADNQVMVGKAPDFFGNGRGAGFLADMTALREQFDLFQIADTPEGLYHLKLIPHRQNQDITAVHLVIAKDTYHIAEIITYNIYEDETRIKLFDIFFTNDIDDSAFEFTIPPGTVVVQMAE